MSNFAIATHYNQQGCRYTFYSHPFGALISIITPPVYEGQLGPTFDMQIHPCYMLHARLYCNLKSKPHRLRGIIPAVREGCDMIVSVCVTVRRKHIKVQQSLRALILVRGAGSFSLQRAGAKSEMQNKNFCTVLQNREKHAPASLIFFLFSFHPPRPSCAKAHISNA